MYQALYRKYRPAVFSDVVGQSHITRTLQKQVAENRTSHAYLFTGSRGTGKTTCAKILARAVNCENPRDGNPCGACPACLSLEDGNSLDVLELDAASNNGVDQVRALRDEAAYPPANVRKRVYIVDEVHMLSVSAFNALLKILEEPPEHLMFILATTELHKVPATILSRCQRYAFRRISPADIAARLRYVAGREQIPLTDDGAELLARLAEGALRDGLSLLDQCAASGGTVDSAAVLNTLGLAGHLQTAALLEHILRKDVPSALSLFGELYDSGRDGVTVLRELAALVRDLLLKRMAPEGSAALLSGGYDDATLNRLESLSTAARLLYLATSLQGVGAEFADAKNNRLNTELCLLRLCDETLSGDMSALVARIERLEAGYSAAPIPRPAAPAVQIVPPPAAPPVARPTPPPQNNVPQPDDAPPWDDEPPPENVPSWDNEPPENMSPWDDVLPPLDDLLPRDDVPQSNDALLPDDLPSYKTGSTATSTSDTPTEDTTLTSTFIWDDFIKRCKARLPPSVKSYLGTWTGTLTKNGTLNVYMTSTCMNMKLFDKKKVRSVLKEESDAKRVVLHATDKRSPKENQDELLEESRQLPGVFQIIGEQHSETDYHKEK
ncbi:MAG: DNA polymerase III subunit gamma/tau [Oscillibacter sp.]|nr:DNA polymerase III subunit gamma/tau [Oscillibacter sp.]